MNFNTTKPKSPKKESRQQPSMMITNMTDNKKINPARKEKKKMNLNSLSISISNIISSHKHINLLQQNFESNSNYIENNKYLKTNKATATSKRIIDKNNKGNIRNKNDKTNYNNYNYFDKNLDKKPAAPLLLKSYVSISHDFLNNFKSDFSNNFTHEIREYSENKALLNLKRKLLCNK